MSEKRGGLSLLSFAHTKEGLPLFVSVTPPLVVFLVVFFHLFDGLFAIHDLVQRSYRVGGIMLTLRGVTLAQIVVVFVAAVT